MQNICMSVVITNYGTKSHGWLRGYGKNARPESASCCLRAAVDRRSRQLNSDFSLRYMPHTGNFIPSFNPLTWLTDTCVTVGR